MALKMVVICGTPTPETMREVQMDPGPMPTLIASMSCLTLRFAGITGTELLMMFIESVLVSKP